MRKLLIIDRRQPEKALCNGNRRASLWGNRGDFLRGKSPAGFSYLKALLTIVAVTLLGIGLAVVIWLAPWKLLSKATLLEKYSQLIKELNLVTKIELCWYSDSKPAVGKLEYENLQYAFVRTVRGPVKMKLDAHTGKPYFISSAIIAEKLSKQKHDGSYVLDPDNKLHTKTEDEVKVIAEGLLKKIPQHQTSELQLESIKFESKEEKGSWVIRWKRTHKGYPYLKDSIMIRYHEKYGLSSYSNHFNSNTCPTEVKIPEEEAKEKALVIVPEAMQSSCILGFIGVSCKEWFDGFEVIGVEKSELMIVNPNYLFVKNLPDMSRHTRLAWVIHVKIKYTKVWRDDASMPEKTIFIWIDASNGKMLGGALAMQEE